jgi:16S rRNA (guanine527-N7)-methyltransferase
MDRINQIDTFNRLFQVSRETIISLEKFEKLVLIGNKKLNLIGKSTEKDIWKRHIMDSFQVIDFVDKKDKLLIDIGTGAGFPGIVLAIAAKDRKIPLQVILIEKSKKKTKFLEEAIRKLNLNIKIICKNILEEENTIADVFVARAFKPLEVVLKLIHNQTLSYKKFFIFQGKTGSVELLQASKNWNIEYKQRVSVTSNDSKILEINNLRKRQIA